MLNIKRAEYKHILAKKIQFFYYWASYCNYIISNKNKKFMQTSILTSQKMFSTIDIIKIIKLITYVIIIRVK